ncbi:hypothetical protein HY440_01860 [Candidatus Microgenomates bacterium]|nr:hypothetical protein [Candidatus Microgenomates bacterium]
MAKGEYVGVIEEMETAKVRFGAHPDSCLAINQYIVASTKVSAGLDKLARRLGMDVETAQAGGIFVDAVRTTRHLRAVEGKRNGRHAVNCLALRQWKQAEERG